ncbi:hypothetical protein GCM10011571_13140 [Marinithermofilum abyssi]|uniref:Uncharacterized protein n=1 Tax=Marinithermofilum abyssi TaxID=1571185 RepID=A0A8J2VFZ2_9BACL|nr:hypothetical protein [Marinithermofilum abyssi]GGE13103.1 hypothetical protein GCM10011571_13140 [Marinithermofilum abyssi]
MEQEFNTTHVAICQVCGSEIKESKDSVLKECCSNQWVKQQIDFMYR